MKSCCGGENAFRNNTTNFVCTLYINENHILTFIKYTWNQSLRDTITASERFYSNTDSLTCKLKFLASLKAGISTNSKRNCCGKPPSKPGSHSTCNESLDWFDTEQFCNANGRPVK